MTNFFTFERLRRTVLAAGLGVAVVLYAGGNAAAAVDPATQARQAMTGFLQPSMAGFAEAAETMRQGVDALCSEGQTAGAKTVARVHEQFAGLLGAWSRLAFLRFGPLQEDNRYERLYFWPDPRGLVVRQMRPLLAEGEGGPTDDDIATHSVAVQGLPALELILFGDAANNGVPGTAACRHARAVAANVLVIASAVQQEWQPEGAFGRRFLAPGDSNPYYRSAAERNNEIVKALAGGLQFIEAAELAPLLPSGDKVALRRAPFWRSGLTFLHVKEHLQGIADFYRSTGFSLPGGQQWAQNAWLAEMDRAIALSGELAGQAPDEWQAGRIEVLEMMIENARGILVEDVAPGLGVTIGFNALDGD